LTHSAPSTDAPKHKHPWITGLVIYILPVILFGLALLLGRYPITPGEVGRSLLSPFFPNLAADIPEVAQQLVLRIRLPRALAALLIGASFGATGTAFQAIFKNPLVDSNILGVTSGAGFGAALATPGRYSFSPSLSVCWRSFWPFLAAVSTNPARCSS